MVKNVSDSPDEDPPVEPLYSPKLKEKTSTTKGKESRKLARLQTIQYALLGMAIFHIVALLLAAFEVGDQRNIETFMITTSLTLTTLIGAIIGSSFD